MIYLIMGYSQEIMTEPIENRKRSESGRTTPTSRTSDWPPVDQLGFWKIAERRPDRLALVLPDGSSRTFGDLLGEANRLAHGFRKLGLRRGDCFAALLPNGADYYTIHLAASQSGLYFCPLNHHLQGPEIAYVLDDSESKLLIAHEDFSDAALGAVRMASELTPDRCFAIGSIEDLPLLSDLTKDCPDTPPDHRIPGLVMPYTSGTTGRPKGVRLPLPEGDPSDIAAQGTVFARAFGLRPMNGAHLVVGPLYHAGPSVFSWGSLNVGHVQILTHRFDAEEILKLIATYRVTSTHLVATMFHRLLALPAEVRNRYDVSSLRMVAHSAAPTPVEVKRRMMEWWGPVLWETYGGTEGAATIAKPHHWQARPGTVGRAIRGVKLKVLNEEGKPCAPGEPGTIYFEREGPRFEYWKDDAKTRSSYRDDAMTLGDIGYLDEEGFLFLTGRLTETIISGGVNIYPAEIESVLLTHPEVVDVAVLGAPDEEWGERVVAVVQPSPDSDRNELEETLIRFCRDRIAHYKCPKEIHFRSELPRAESGKLYRLRLREEFWKESGRSI